MSEQVLQATLDSVREGVGTFGVGGRLQAWNKTFPTMLGVVEGDLRPGAPLHLGNTLSNELSRRVRDVETAVQGADRPTLVEHRGDRDSSVEIFYNPIEERRLRHYASRCDRATQIGRGTAPGAKT
jgi:PAS domain-containing protein